ncbi:hypothetical protein [Amycolatopsis sp. A1MSW2902]|uniref:hypothetical protein n=1 Tax=Amycolatopsis sp. A1MSW2902 TaxID=687413 RepID=UPI00307F1794
MFVADLAALRGETLAHLGGDVLKAGDLLLGQPVEPVHQLDVPSDAGLDSSRRPVGPGQFADLVQVRREQRDRVLLGHDPPGRIADGGEIQPPRDRPEVRGQADHGAEVPHVLVEDRTARAVVDGEAERGAQVQSLERRPVDGGPGRAADRGCDAHEVRSSGRKGSSAS